MSGVEGPMSESIPEARIVRRDPGRRWSWAWALTASAVFLAIATIVSQTRGVGRRIEITFRQGHGLEIGAALRHRGIEIGRVEQIELAEDLQRIVVSVRLDSRAYSVAREGSRFWIVRPELAPGRIGGLDTIVGAKYLEVQPATSDARPAFRFEGDETPLTVLDDRATSVVVQFAEGRGLSAGDAVRYRGVKIGEVVDVRLNDAREAVEATIRLFGQESPFARVGSRYWIERPLISLAEIRGLDTILSGRHVVAEAGAEGAALTDRFVGLEEPPIGVFPEGGLEIVLEAPRAEGLEVGATIEHRGIEIGRIVTSDLAGDGTHVEARAWIEPRHRALVRGTSQFWIRSGIRLDAGLTGFSLETGTLDQVLSGGVGMATPDRKFGEPVHHGHRFRVGEEPEDWAEWIPRLPVGTHKLATDGTLPRVERVSITWQERRWGWKGERRRTGWALWVEGNRWLGPRSLFEMPERAIGMVSLEAAGKRFDLGALGKESIGELVAVETQEELVDVEPWPLERIRVPVGPEDALLLPGDREAIPLVGERTQVQGGTWALESSLSLVEEQIGAPVVAVSDGKVIGMLGWFNSQGAIVPMIPSESWNEASDASGVSSPEATR